MSLNFESIDSLALPNGVQNFKSFATQGFGVPAIYRFNTTAVATTANSAVVTLTPPTTAGTYLLGGNIALTSGTNTGTVGFVVDYVDGNGTTHTQDVVPLAKADGTIVTTGTAASTDWKMLQIAITIDNSATAITIETVVTGSVHYIATAYIMQIG